MESDKIHETKLTKIGNSQTIRIPKKFVDRFFPEKEVLLEATSEGLLILPKKKLSYKKAAMEMAEENENWEEWNSLGNTGIEKLGEW